MRVALTVSEFPAVSETFVLRRMTELLQRGWDVHVVCETSSSDGWRWFPEAERDRSLRKRVHVRPRTPSRRRVVLSMPIAFVHTFLRAPAGTIRYFKRGVAAWGRSVFTHFVEDAVLVRLDPDIIHFEFGHLAVNREVIGDLIDAAVVASFQGHDLNYVGLDAEPGYYAELWRQIDAAHVVSADLLERARRRGLPSNLPSFVVLNGVDTTRFDGMGRSHTDVVGTADRPLRLLSVGRLHWKKGYTYALEAIRLLRDAGLRCDYRIVGDGEFRDAVLFDLSDLALEGAVTLTGALPSAGVRELMAWADVFIHPAVSEGFCLSVAEAQSMGVPVVVSDADGLRENVADGVTGYVVGRRDASALSERISQLAADPAMRDRMGRAGTARVAAEFGLEAHVRGIELVYREAVSHRLGRRASKPSELTPNVRS